MTLRPRAHGIEAVSCVEVNVTEDMFMLSRTDRWRARYPPFNVPRRRSGSGSGSARLL